MRATIYARVSTDRQGRQQTIDSQIDKITSTLTRVTPGRAWTGLDGLRDAAAQGDSPIVPTHHVWGRRPLAS